MSDEMRFGRPAAGWGQLSEDSLLKARADGQHATCRFGKEQFRATGAPQDVIDGIEDCGWSGPMTEMVIHGLGDWRCPNGHGGNNLAFHPPGDPAPPIPPYFDRVCSGCGLEVHTQDPSVPCFDCGAPLAEGPQEGGR